ncbi:MAG: hypothetical protein IGR76_13145 [Synechococcales cyanobacterium T60_A2020_003]|nr:hypothetical protein [Synechococcales cyanobacterium T60_A2020_003]
MLKIFLDWLNTALMVDLFIVLFSFFWFGIALVGQALDIPLGFDLWYSLWEPVFTPAIGILMTGAILSGIAGWINKRVRSNSGA